jgi:hypothetical protein
MSIDLFYDTYFRHLKPKCHNIRKCQSLISNSVHLFIDAKHIVNTDVSWFFFTMRNMPNIASHLNKRYIFPVRIEINHKSHSLHDILTLVT